MPGRCWETCPVSCGGWCRVQQVNCVLVTVAYEHPPGHLLMCLLHFIAQTPHVCNVLITAINLVLLTLSKHRVFELYHQQGLHQANKERDLVFTPCAVQKGSVPTVLCDIHIDHFGFSHLKLKYGCTQVLWNRKKPGLVEGVAAHGKEVGKR